MSLNLGSSDRQLTSDSLQSLSDAEKMELQQFLSNESQKAGIQESLPSHAFIPSILFSIPALNGHTIILFPSLGACHLLSPVLSLVDSSKFLKLIRKVSNPHSNSPLLQ